MNAKDLQIEYHTAQESPWLNLAKRIVIWDITRMALAKEDGAMRVYNESRFLKYQDLDGMDVVVTISNVTRDDIKEKDGTSKKKFVVHFKELEKGLVLNTTNMNMLYKLLMSDDSDNWVGKRITLYTKDDIEMGGEIMSGIRIRAKLPL